jgi:hypothetical protein
MEVFNNFLFFDEQGAGLLHQPQLGGSGDF